MTKQFSGQSRQGRYERLLGASNKVFALLHLSGTEVLENKCLRFRIASHDEAGVLRLRDILSFQYSTAIARSYAFDIWHLDCASDPQMNCKDESSIQKWLGEMIALADQHSCDFSSSPAR
ncbi:hypothetical protein [Stieleria neptunia]|uniref:hypothetical protein n=1 Tax=Stieleria neptunia TaxID=2527979 RepID=UPI00119E8304|nr:hypothetical protein [Stieleria neptunia]